MSENTITFKRLNNLYSDMEGIDVLVRLIDENVKRDGLYSDNVMKLQNYVVTEVEDYNKTIFAMGDSDAKNRTRVEGDEYFKTLVRKLSRELKLRGMNNEAQEVNSFAICDIDSGMLPKPRMTEKQYIRSLRSDRVKYGMSCGMNKTNAGALSLIIEQLCEEVYGS